MSVPCMTCFINVYDRDGTTLRDSLEGKGITIVQDFGMEGGAQFTASMWEDALAANPDLLREAWVKVSTDFGSGEVEFASFLSQIGSGTIASADGEAVTETSPAGRGPLSFFADARMAHEKGWLAYDISPDNMRYWGPMSGFFDDSAWGVPLTMRWYDDPSARAGFPAEMLDIDEDAEWIAVTDPVTDSVPKGTVNWVRKQITVGAETEIGGWFTADNFVRVFFDSELIWDGREDIYNWKGLQYWSATVPAGTYTIAARIENAARTGGSNPIAFLGTFWSLDTSGNRDTLLTHTNDTWTCFDATDDPAGLTVGQSILQFIDEAVGRDLPALGRLNPTFDAVNDSDGAPWPVDEERSYAIGDTTGLDFVLQLGETSADIEVTPSGDLNAYVSKGSDLSATVALTEGQSGNIVSYTHDGQARSGTRCIVKTQDTTVQVISDETELLYDAREDYFESGGSVTRAQGIKVAVRSLDDTAHDRITYTAEITALTGHIPLVDFNVGDTIMALDLSRSAAPMVVTSITGTFGETGPWTWSIELEEP